MDIAIIIPSLDKYGGAERVAIECIRRWQDRHVLTLYSTEIDEALLHEHGVGDRVARRYLTPHFTGEHAMVLNAVLLPKIWRQEIGRHDAYHAHLWPTHLVDLHPTVWYAHEPLRVLYDLRFEYGLEAHGNTISRSVHVYPKHRYDDHVGDTPHEAYLAAIDAMDKTALPTRVIANSRYAARYLESVYGKPVGDVVYPGVDIDEFIALPTDPNLFVTIGQLWPHKRVGLLIEAVSLTDETQLVVIGSGPERDRLAGLAARLGVQDRVFFMSGLANNELRLILARACAFLFASIKEPFGIAVLEAMAAGLAVIAADEGGYVEICNEASAFLLPPFPSAFAEKMSYLQRNPDVAKAMGRAGKQIASGYPWSRTADAIEAILADAARESMPSVAPRPSGPRTTRIGAQYYLWYGEGYGAAHWNDNPRSGAVQDRPLLGYYNSHRGQTIEHHLDLFASIGLDFAVLNLHVDEGGPNQLELVGIRHVFDIAALRDSPVRFAVQIAPYGASAAVVQDVVGYIASEFSGRDTYLQQDGRPVLFWFWSGALDGDAAYISACKAEAVAFCNIATSLRLPSGPDEAKRTFGMFEGMAPFSPLELSSPTQWERVWQSAYDASERAGLPVRVATISPGYDDRGLDDDNRRGNPFRDVPRSSGETYCRSMAFVEALANRPDLVIVSTFNEFHENSHIEPTLGIRNLYVDLTRDFVARFNKGTPSQ